MKKSIFKVFLIGILGMFVVAGCTWVGASDFLRDSNSGRNDIEKDLSQETEHIDKNENGRKDETDLNPDKDTARETEEDENNKDIDETDKNNTGETKPDDKPDSGDIRIHYSGDGTKKLVALTFDDGPESKMTPEILDILDEYDIKATFFIIGQNAAKNTDALKEIYNRGHEIGNHSWSHKYLPKISKKSKEDEILKTEKLLIDVLGEHTPIFRPPYGAVKKQDKQLIGSLGYNVVNWSVDTRDWAGTSNEQMMKYVKQQLKPGGIILMHSNGGTGIIKNTVSVLPVMIEWITEQGYEFVTVTEILN